MDHMFGKAAATSLCLLGSLAAGTRKPMPLTGRSRRLNDSGGNPLPWVAKLKKSGWFAALPVALLLAGATGTTTAFADDAILTKAPVVSAPAGPASCDSVPAFFLTTCQLAMYGIRLYGVIDVGAGYQTNGAPFNPQYPQGSSYLVQKMNRSAMWTLAPNAMSRSSIGVQIKEPLAPGWAFVARLEAGFDPYSLQFSNGPASIAANRGIPLDAQSANNDSSHAGGLDNSLGYLGFSSDVFGTLTFFRQNALTLDGVFAYDPMAGSYAFSALGFSSSNCGAGDTETCRINTAIKYRVNIGALRIGALAQVGGYNLNNGSNGDYEGQIGGDIPVANFGWGSGVLSLDAIYKWEKDAVALSLSGVSNVAGVPVAPFLPQTLTATISNNQSVMLLSKYAVGPLKVYAGYEWYQLAPPSDPVNTVTGFSNIGGLPMGSAYANLTAISNVAYSAGCGTGTCRDKVMQVMWTGARYAVSNDLDIAAGYYHYIQNGYTTASCANPAAHSQCEGTFDAVSTVVDWRFLPKWDAYFGIMFSQVNAGLSNGYLARNNLDPTVGLRFRF
jgi:predicted porin